jgi:DNA-binding XRE family transcriptional regulator
VDSGQANDPDVDPDHAGIVATLTAARLAGRLTQAELAYKAGLSQAAVSRIEGVRSTSVRTLATYARAIGFRVVAIPAHDWHHWTPHTPVTPTTPDPPNRWREDGAPVDDGPART